MVPLFVEVEMDVPDVHQPVYIDLLPRGPSIRVEKGTDFALVRQVLAELC